MDSASKKKGTQIILFVSLPLIYPRVSEMKFNPADLHHLTTDLDDHYQEDEPFSGSEERSASTMNLNCDAIVTAIRETAETFKNIKPHAPMDTHSTYVHWNYDILPTPVKKQFLIKQHSTTIQTSSSLVPYSYEEEVGSFDPDTDEPTMHKQDVTRQYWSDGYHKLISIDGIFFDLTPRAAHENKNFVNRFPELRNRDP